MIIPGEFAWVHAVALWHVAMSLAAFLLCVMDKYQARRGGERVPESRLVVLSGLGGWPGALAAMLLARHKTAKGTFQLKFVAAVLVWCAVAALVVLLMRR